MAEREEFNLVETRLISGRGLFKYSPDDADRHFWLYAAIVRYPKVDYGSSKFNPDKSEYAKITWLRDGYVVREDAVNYERQAYQYAVDPTGYLASSLVCMYTTILETIFPLYLGVPLVPPVIDPLDKIYTEPLVDSFSEIRIVCRESAAIEFKLYRLKYDVNCPAAEPTPKKPPPPPEPPPPLPPGSPIGDISPPYDEETDGGNTIPYSSDETVPPEDPDLPFGTPVTVVVEYRFFYLFGGQIFTETRDLFYPWYIERDEFYAVLRIRSAAYVGGEWDEVSYLTWELAIVYNAQNEPQYEIISATDNQDTDPPTVIIPFND